DLLLDLVHVDVLDGLEELLELCLGQGAGTLVEQDPVPEGHEGRHGGDVRQGGELRVVVDVDLGEGDVRVRVCGVLEDRRELATGAAPGRPEVDDHGSVARDHGAEQIQIEIGDLGHGFHANPPGSGRGK